MTTTSPAAPAALARDARTIALVGLAHGTSHFFHLLLPPLFPWFIRDFGYSYAELGALVSIFFLVSALGQAAAGFVVDRVGARPVLYLALCSFAAAALVAAGAHGFAALGLAAALAGLGNSPFHPIDFSILNHRVSASRLGHAFSVHGISGNLGWAAAPVFLSTLTTVTGTWRLALLGAAVWALGVLALLVWRRDDLQDRAPGMLAHGARHALAPGEHPLAFLRLPSIWLSFLFFFFVTGSFSAIQSFAAPCLHQLFGLPVAGAALVVTAYTACGALGMVVGGFWAAREAELDRIIARCLFTSAVLLFAVGQGWVPALPGRLGAGWAAFAMVALAGVGVGMAGPSRDMLIKRAAPPGATGRVYGTVYSGLDLGFALSAPVFGSLLDHGHPQGVFIGSALALCVGLSSASAVGVGLRARQAGLGGARA